MSSSPLVLITGGNGFVGYSILVETLKAGYNVRAVVRRQDAIDTISRGPSVQTYLSRGALSFVLVSDNTQPGAYNEAARECTYIIHVASPLPTVPGDLVPQAIAGTKAALDAAEATPSIKRVVFTSSSSTIRPFERLFASHPANRAVMSGKGDEVPTINDDTLVPTQPPVSDDAEPIRRYMNSKIASANFVYEYSNRPEAERPHFSIVQIKPGYVLGPEELTRSKTDALKGSNMILGFLFQNIKMGPFLGLPADEDAPLLAETVHLDDVAEAHVKALDTGKVPGMYRNFLLCSDGPTGPVMMDAVDTVRKELPQEVASGKIPFAGRLGTIPHKFNASAAERDLLSHAFQPYSKQVKDTIKWFVNLPDAM